MSAEYSVEEVLESARKAAASNGRAKEASMLFAYAERIKADEVAVPIYQRKQDGNWQDLSEDQYNRVCNCALTITRILYLAPPTQADEVAVPDSMIVLLNHLERLMDSGILPEDAIPVDMWNAVSMHNFAHPPAQKRQWRPLVTDARDFFVPDEGMNCDHCWVTGGFGPTTCMKCGRTSPPAQGAQVDQVGELLAIIHGDGGHYQAEHGLQKAAKDAQEKVIQMMTKIATAEPATQGEEVSLREAAEEALALLELLDPEHGMTTQLRKSLAAQPHAVPDGWVLVPVEPTDAMCDAGDLPATATAYDIYKAMLAAAPSQGESQS